MDGAEREFAEDVFERALAERGMAALDRETCADLGKLTDFMTVIVGIACPDSGAVAGKPGLITMESGSLKGGQLGLVSLFDQMEPSDLDDCRETIIARIGSLVEGLRTIEDGSADPMAFAKGAQIVPILKDDRDLEIMRTGHGGPAGTGMMPICWPVVGGLHAVVAFNLPQSLKYIDHGLLARLDTTEADLVAKAKAGLLDLVASDPPRVEEIRDIRVVGGMSGLASSLLLVDGFWKTQSDRMGGGDLVIHVESRETLYFARRDDGPSVISIAMAARDGQIDTRFPGKLFMYSGGVVKRFDSDDHPGTVRN